MEKQNHITRYLKSPWLELLVLFGSVVLSYIALLIIAGGAESPPGGMTLMNIVLFLCGFFVLSFAIAVIAVMAGIGGGALLLSGLGDAMFARASAVLSVFRGLGVIYGGVILLAALPLRFPPGIEVPKTGHHTAELLRDGYFWGLCCGLFAGTFGGLLVIGNLKPLLLAQNVDHVTATAAISVFAAGNACGRIGWGWLADRLGALAIPLSLAFLALTLPLLLLLPGSAPGAILASALIGCGFGACFVVYAAQISTHYGVANIAAVYPLVFLSYGLSGLAGPSVGGLIFDATASYSSGIIVSLVIVFCGLAASRQLMRAPVAQRCFPEGEPV